MKYPLPRFQYPTIRWQESNHPWWGDSAVDWALAFEKIAPTTLVHRRDTSRLGT